MCGSPLTHPPTQFRPTTGGLCVAVSCPAISIPYHTAVCHHKLPSLASRQLPRRRKVRSQGKGRFCRCATHALTDSDGRIGIRGGGSTSNTAGIASFLSTAAPSDAFHMVPYLSIIILVERESVCVAKLPLQPHGSHFIIQVEKPHGENRQSTMTTTTTTTNTTTNGMQPQGHATTPQKQK